MTVSNNENPRSLFVVNGWERGLLFRRERNNCRVRIISQMIFCKKYFKVFYRSYVLAITCVSRALRYLPYGIAKGGVSRNEADPLSSQNGPFRNAVWCLLFQCKYNSLFTTTHFGWQVYPPCMEEIFFPEAKKKSQFVKSACWNVVNLVLQEKLHLFKFRTHNHK